MNWKEFAREVHQVAVEKGLWDKPVSFDEIALECHAALTQAWEEHKDGRPNVYHLCVPSIGKPCSLDCGEDVCTLSSGDPCKYRGSIPHGVSAELAGCVLRLLDCMGAQKETEFTIEVCPYKCDDITTLRLCHQNIADVGLLGSLRFVDASDSIIGRMTECIGRIMTWAKLNGVDMEAVLREVLEYSKRCSKAGTGT